MTIIDKYRQSIRFLEVELIVNYMLSVTCLRAVLMAIANLYKTRTSVLCKWEEGGKITWLPSNILSHPVPGKPGGQWKVEWMTRDFQPYYDDKGNCSHSVVLNEEDCRLISNTESDVSTRTPTSFTSSTNQEDVTEKRLIPWKKIAKAGIKVTSEVWNYFSEPTYQQWKGSLAQVTFCTVEVHGKPCMSGFKNFGSPQPMANHLATMHPEINKSDRKKEETQNESNRVANPFELARTQAQTISEKTTPYSKKHVKFTTTLSLVSDWIASVYLYKLLVHRNS